MSNHTASEYPIVSDAVKARHRRRGVVFVLVVALLFVLFVCASFAIDVGHICAVCAEMQNNADAAALGGAEAMRSEGDEDPISEARKMIEMNQSRQGFSSLDDQIIELGNWTPETGFKSLDETGGTRAYAIRAEAHRSKTPYFFAAIMGKHSANVFRHAVALGSGPCNGVWGLTGVNAGSIVTDSYISTDGPYNGLTALDNGDVCSCKDIKIHGSKVINGDVMPGFGYSVTVAGVSGNITGYTTNTIDNCPSVPVDPGDVKYNNDNDTIPPKLKDGSKWYKGSINSIDMQAGGNLNLPPGTFYFDSIKLSGGATITITGPTTIYVGGSVDATGGAIVNKSANPQDLTLIALGSDLKLGGGVNFYGTILSPNAHTVLACEHIYGTVIGGYLELKGNTNIHVDQTLPWANMFSAPRVMLVE